MAIDAIRFLEICDEAKQEDDCKTRIRLLAEARDLYRADLLTEYDALWVVAERVRFSRCYEQALRDLAEAYRQQQDETGMESTSLCPHT